MCDGELQLFGKAKDSEAAMKRYSISGQHIPWMCLRMRKQVGALRGEILEIDKRVAETERLLRLADPEGYFKEGTCAALAAKAKGLKAMQVGCSTSKYFPVEPWNPT